MESILDILKQTPKNNCGKCGYPTCMAFAAAVHTGATLKASCPYVESDDNDFSEVAIKDDPETALIKELKAKIKGLDLKERADGLGGQFVKTIKGEAICFKYLGKDVFISSHTVFLKDGTELETRDQILLYNYLFWGGKGDLSGDWVGLESFPNSISKVVTLKRYVEEKIARCFAGRPQDLVTSCKALGAQQADECQADACMLVPVLPKVPVLINFWDEDKDDGFPAEVKTLFDKRALDFLDIESLIFCAERLAETITKE